jgi:hypothetical protein
VGKQLIRSEPTFKIYQRRCQKILTLKILNLSLKISDSHFQPHRAIAELGKVPDDELQKMQHKLIAH